MIAEMFDVQLATDQFFKCWIIIRFSRYVELCLFQVTDTGSKSEAKNVIGKTSGISIVFVDP